jgi:phosphoglycolate phosphatase
VIRNLILDWSGTLVDDLASVLDATNHALRAAGHSGLTRDEFRLRFRLPVQDFYDRLFPGLSQEALQQAFHARFAQVQGEVSVLPHAREFLEFARRRGCRVYLLTTVPDPYLRQQLGCLGLGEWFTALCTGVADKRVEIRALIERHGLEATETLFVGDMEHDIEAAVAGGVRSCAVLTGYQTAQALRAWDPDLLVEHLGELREILDRQHMELDEARRGARRRPLATVGALIERASGLCLMVRTRKWSDLWGIPGGKIEYGETGEEALRREVLEETALVVEGIRLVLVQDCVESPEFYRPEHFVLLNYVCQCREPAEVKLNDEAEEFRWVTRVEALALPLNRPTRVLLERAGEWGTPS